MLVVTKSFITIEHYSVREGWPKIVESALESFQGIAR